jgi:hypothetical protein
MCTRNKQLIICSVVQESLHTDNQICGYSKWAYSAAFRYRCIRKNTKYTKQKQRIVHLRQQCQNPKRCDFSGETFKGFEVL